MIRAQFRIQLPDDIWVREVSTAFPEATFRLLAGYYHDDTATELGEIITGAPQACIDTIRSHPAIVTFDLLESADRRVLAKYETTDTDFYEFVETSALPVEFPVVATRGWFEFDLTGTRSEFDALQSILDDSPVRYELQSVVSTTDRGDVLTPRQREVLEAAIRAGYFEVPRECTLAELASTLDIDKATASTIIRRGEATLVKWFLSGPDTNGQSVF